MPFSFTAFKIGLFVAWTLAAAAAAVWTTHKVDLASYQKLELKYAAAQAEAVKVAVAEQKRLDDISRQAAQQEANRQAALAKKAQAQLAEIKSHVTDNRPCITYGLVRVLDAAVHGVTASSLRLPAGGTDDACAPVTASALADAIIRNYAAAIANAEQLDALIAVNRKLVPVK